MSENEARDEYADSSFFASSRPGEWRRMLEGEFTTCGAKVVHQAHNVPCDLEPDHEGEHIATERTIIEHNRGGKRACVNAGCGFDPAP